MADIYENEIVDNIAGRQHHRLGQATQVCERDAQREGRSTRIGNIVTI
jgi:hypothetical protein